jgi:hypothetical protein
MATNGGVMTPLGWTFMLLSLTFVWTLVGWCYYKILSQPPERVAQPAKDFQSA